MKIRINDVLESVNKAIDSIRKEKGIEGNGHFVSVTHIHKSMGPYKQCYINIIYVNTKYKMNYEFCSNSFMERILNDDISRTIDKFEQQALTTFFIKCRDEWENIIEGNYGTQ